MTQARDSSRSRRVLRLIALERIARSLFLLAAGTYLVSHLGSDFGRIADHLTITGVAAIGYGALELVEGVGLWLDQLWAEYLTLIATSLLIPLELYELILKPSLLKAGGIAVNIAIVGFLAWMLRRRRLRLRAG